MKDSNDLFELCKEVYEATGWRGEDGFITTIGGKWIKDVKKGWFDETIDSDGFYPLYTSDYLLEKLPKVIDGYYFTLELCDAHESLEWAADYIKLPTQYLIAKRPDTADDAHGDTPLKALLKLCLALDKEGVL